MIRSERLRLVPATPAIMQADLEGPAALAVALGTAVPASWPPEFFDADAVRFILDRVAANPEEADWWLHYFVLAGPEPQLVGVGGFKGAPSAGVVEVGYSVLPEHRRRGYAAEATAALAARAFADPAVSLVCAHTLPALGPSIGVLEKCGFRFTGPGPEAGTLRYELTRPPGTA